MGHRGYIGSRGYFGADTPQHVQNLVVRDFCARSGFQFLLSATEYIMPSCYMILEDLVREAPRLNGIVCYSIFMLPVRQERRLDLVERVLAHGATMHGAVENIHIRNEDDLASMQMLWAMRDMQTSSTFLSADLPALRRHTGAP